MPRQRQSALVQSANHNPARVGPGATKGVMTMPIEMLRIVEGGEYASAPTVVCDACGRDIKNASLAWYLWFFASIEQGARTSVYFAHKGACIDHLEAIYGQPMWSGELREFVTFLARSIGVDTSKPFPMMISAS